MRRLLVLGGLLAALLLPSSAGYGSTAAVPKTTISGRPATVTRSGSATFAFTADDPAATFACALDQEPFADCSSPKAYTGLSEGRHVFFVLASGPGGTEATPASWVWTVDRVPPAAPAGVRPRVGYGRLQLTWKLDAGASAVVYRSADVKQSAQTKVYAGSAASYADTRFVNVDFHRYRIVAVDGAGNASRGVVVDVPASALLVAPRDGGRVRSTTTLRWRAVPKATYYNVQLYRAGRKILSAWPVRPARSVNRTWSYGGRRQSLSPGVYTWYVWPGFGPRARGSYGQPLGQGTFRVG